MLAKGSSRSTPSQAAANRTDTNQNPVPARSRVFLLPAGEPQDGRRPSRAATPTAQARHTGAQRTPAGQEFVAPRLSIENNAAHALGDQPLERSAQRDRTSDRELLEPAD